MRADADPQNDHRRGSCVLPIALFFSAAACGDLTVPILERIPPAPQPDGAASAPVRYEAEVPPALLVQSAIVDSTCFGSNLICPPGGVHEGAECCSAGGVVTEILGRVPCSGPPGSAQDYQGCQMIGAGVEFHDVTVPAAGTYDVTWWYHCGQNNSFGDTSCGGLHYTQGSSCRPQLIDVNGVPMSTTLDGQVAAIYQFPCYSGSWPTIHGATTALPLAAGSNTIFFHAPHAITLDSADIDAIDVLPEGQGAPPRVTPVTSGY